MCVCVCMCLCDVLHEQITFCWCVSICTCRSAGLCCWFVCVAANQFYFPTSQKEKKLGKFE